MLMNMLIYLNFKEGIETVRVIGFEYASA